MGRVRNYLIIFVDDNQISFSVSLTPAFSKQLNIQKESNAAPKVRKDILLKMLRTKFDGWLSLFPKVMLESCASEKKKGSC